MGLGCFFQASVTYPFIGVFPGALARWSSSSSTWHYADESQVGTRTTSMWDFNSKPPYIASIYADIKEYRITAYTISSMIPQHDYILLNILFSTHSYDFNNWSKWEWMCMHKPIIDKNEEGKKVKLLFYEWSVHTPTFTVWQLYQTK